MELLEKLSSPAEEKWQQSKPGGANFPRVGHVSALQSPSLFGQVFVKMKVEIVAESAFFLKQKKD